LKNVRPAAAKETLFLWTGGNIQKIRKPAKAPKEAPEPGPAVTLSPAEKRRYPRLDLKLPILYRVLGAGASKIPSTVRPYLLARTTNVSPLGLCLNLSEQLSVGTVLALSIHVLDNRERFSAVGQVLWTQSSDMPGHWLTGVQFVVVEGDTVKKEHQTRMESLMLHLDKPG
jgi:hypothetical protein